MAHRQLARRRHDGLSRRYESEDSIPAPPRAARPPRSGGSLSEDEEHGRERGVADVVDEPSSAPGSTTRPREARRLRRRHPPARPGRAGDDEDVDHTGSKAASRRNDGRKIAQSASAAPASAVRLRLLDRPQVGREREQRPRHRLHEPVAGEELLLADPPGLDDGLVEQAEARRARRRRRASPSAPSRRPAPRRAGRSRRRRREPDEERDEHGQGCNREGPTTARDARRRTAGAGARRRRNANTPTAAPSPIAATWPANPPTSRTTAAPAAASAIRGRSGASDRRIDSTARSTTGTATSSRP